MAEGLETRRMARGARAGLVLGALLGAWSACTQPDPEPRVAGSGTELGNVMGVLVTPGRQAAAGVEVTLYPLDGNDSRILRTTTDTNGAFAFHVEDGSFRLLALDGAGNGVTVDSVLPSPQDTINLRETALAPLGGIRGFVKSRPASARLKLLGTWIDTIYPGDTEFIWEGIPAGYYRLNASQWSMPGIPASRQIVVSVAAGAVTALPDTIDLITDNLELTTQQLPYLLMHLVRPLDGFQQDSLYWVLDGERIANIDTNSQIGRISLTETMLDSTRINALQLFAQAGDSIRLVRTWNIARIPIPPPAASWAYHAVRGVILALVPDDRPAARGPGVNVTAPELGTFRVLDKRLLSPEELIFWEWPAVAGLDSSLPGEIQAAVYYPPPTYPRGCTGYKATTGENAIVQHFPGDTVTFYLLPDSNLGAVAFRPRSDERFQDLDRVGFFARADWPLASTFLTNTKRQELRIFLRPEGLKIEWAALYNFQGSQSRCLSTYRRFLVDSAGGVREMLACPTGIDPSRLLLHYRAEFSEGIDADSLPATGKYVYIDSAGSGVAGTPDSVRRFQLDTAALQELNVLLAGLPDPIPLEWEQHEAATAGQKMPRSGGLGAKEDMRYLVGGHRGAVHVREHSEAAPAKADFFTRLESWLRDRGLL